MMYPADIIEEHPIPEFKKVEGGHVSKTTVGDFFISLLCAKDGYTVSYSNPPRDPGMRILEQRITDKSFNTMEEAEGRCRELFYRAAITQLQKTIRQAKIQFARDEETIRKKDQMLEEYGVVVGGVV